MRITTSHQYTYNYDNQRKQNVNFERKLDPTNNSVYHGIRDFSTTCCEKLITKKPIQRFVKFVNNHTKDANKLNMHLMVTGSTIMSGFYVSKTLNNKDMDKKRRKTLAINQGLTYAVSTVMAYTFDTWAANKIKNITTKFMELNPTKNSKLSESWKNGFGMARTIIIGSVVYRFIAPVLVTPIANAISNKFIHKDGSKKA